MSLAMKIDEIPLVGVVTLNSFHLKIDRFIDFSDMYGGTYEVDCRAKIEALSEIVTTRFHIDKIAKKTKDIEIEILGFYAFLDPLEVHVGHAKSFLTVLVKDFGIKEVRKAIHSGDVEGMDGVLTTLVLNINSNLTALQDKGYTDVAFTGLKNLKQKVFDENVIQEGWKGDKEEAVEENMSLFMEVDAIIKDIQKTGRMLFKRESPAIAKEFTMSDVLKKIRNN